MSSHLLKYYPLFTLYDNRINIRALRLKRLVSAQSGPGSSDPSSSSAAGGSSGSSSNRNDAFTVQAMSPDATALSTTYIYAALVVLVIGIIIGKWIF